MVTEPVPVIVMTQVKKLFLGQFDVLVAHGCDILDCFMSSVLDVEERRGTQV
ncbi:MAG: hypothetical protein OK454_06620 [Thaumarchaeota archaeon]|nr:hypothetical protein [Nitrososphaerota archaeon]